MGGNYPPGTWTGDPNAPWNQPEGGPCGSGCTHYAECPCGERFYCIAYDEWHGSEDAIGDCQGFEGRHGAWKPTR